MRGQVLLRSSDLIRYPCLYSQESVLCVGNGERLGVAEWGGPQDTARSTRWELAPPEAQSTFLTPTEELPAAGWAQRASFRESVHAVLSAPLNPVSLVAEELSL